MWDLVRTDRRATAVVAAAVLVMTLVNPFVRGIRVPLLGWVDLAIHEAGHVFFLWAPNAVMLVMGNGFQALVPLVFAVSFVLVQRDLLGGAAALGWCAAALQDASVYIRDAPVRALPLLGPETSHDWWQLLGRNGMLDAAAPIANVVWAVGLLVWAVGLAVLLIGLRWDAEWRRGARGTVFLPWEREIVDAGRVVWPGESVVPPRANPFERRPGETWEPPRP